MKTLRLVGMALFAVLMCVNFASCSNDDGVDNQEPQKYTISLGCVGEILNVTHEPLSRTETTIPIYKIDIISNNMCYASGSFSSIENLTVDLLDGNTYDFKVTFEPNNTAQTPTESFNYQSSSLISEVKYMQYLESDIYYGYTNGYTPTVNGNVDIYMKRVSFGFKVTAEGLDEGATLDINISKPNVSGSDYAGWLDLDYSTPEHEAIYMFDSFSKAYDGVLIDNEYVNYYEEFDLQIILNRIDGIKVVLIEGETIKVERNKKTVLVINVGNSDTTTSNGLTISIENEEMTDGNQYQVNGDEGTITEGTITEE